MRETTVFSRLCLLVGFSALIFLGSKQIPTAAVDGTLPDVSVEIDVGSSSENSVDGPYHWITLSKSRFILVNNTALDTKATLAGTLSVAPCNDLIKITVNAEEVRLSGEIGHGVADYDLKSDVSLRPYERRVVQLDLNGLGCQTPPSDGRVILSKLSRVTFLKIENN